jgi:hypothetical protein
MKILRAFPLAFALTIGSAAAQAPAPKNTPSHSTPAPGEEMSEAEVARWLAFFDKLVDAVATNADNCDKMATDVSGVIDRNKPALDLARSARNSHKKLPASAQQHMMTGVKRMETGIQKCGENDKVKTAFAKLDVSQSESSK